MINPPIELTLRIFDSTHQLEYSSLIVGFFFQMFPFLEEQKETCL